MLAILSEVWLPVLQVSVDGDREVVDVAPLSKCEDLIHRSVVLIEDIDDSRSMLTLDGHRVFAEGNREAGVRAIDRYQPDIALVDIGLPGINGYAAIALEHSIGLDKAGSFPVSCVCSCHWV